MANKTVELNLTMPNYSTKVKGKVKLSKFELIKMNLLSFILLIVVILALLFVIAYLIRLRNLKRKRRR